MGRQSVGEQELRSPSISNGSFIFLFRPFEVQTPTMQKVRHARISVNSYLPRYSTQPRKERWRMTVDAAPLYLKHRQNDNGWMFLAPLGNSFRFAFPFPGMKMESNHLAARFPSDRPCASVFFLHTTLPYHRTSPSNRRPFTLHDFQPLYPRFMSDNISIRSRFPIIEYRSPSDATQTAPQTPTANAYLVLYLFGPHCRPPGDTTTIPWLLVTLHSCLNLASRTPE
ncbi:hypothetical protein ACRALDRAFT_205713 [Sodiomyces alcalophilus JCM 7366]|uniref:uncharacterized protein n=1 Tax=Sodiomyces alcalophilus JCM 7366 TaxID=591952 RepID=UPI0039B51AF3